MIISLLYIILAVLGLSFLIFIHELGHYYMARRVGMRVEAFSIGFGKPIYSWKRDGVEWKIGWLLFGGYVKIAGMDTSETTDPYQVKEGFFGKSPLDRIKVAFMGPFVNIVFALFVFAALWFLGGREKSFGEHTHKIGWVDPQSELYAYGVRPGDEIEGYNDIDYTGMKDNIYAPMTASSNTIEVRGNKVNFFTKEKTPFSYRVKLYPNPKLPEILTAGIISPASYIIYDKFPNGKDNPLPEGSPMKNSGIQYGDRIVWVDGEVIYSQPQVHQLLNDSKALLTIERDGETLLRRVPRIKVGELKLDHDFKEELMDWQFAADLKGKKFEQLYAIPYYLTNSGMVERRVKFIDKENDSEAFPEHSFSSVEKPLESGDKIIAVDGIPITHSYQILANLQQKQSNIVVERDPKLQKNESWTNGDQNFDQEFNPADLNEIISQIGLNTEQRKVGNLVLLAPIVPKSQTEIILSSENRAILLTELQAQKKELQKIENPEKRAHALAQFEKNEKQYVLGVLQLQDKAVNYNPNPFTLFMELLEDIWHTIFALFTGSLNPKWMSGPVGILQTAYDTSLISLKEAFYLLGAISINLGVLNLLPIPVLDGGTICFSLYELFTRKQIKTKTMEKLIIPFALLLIGFFVFITYNDVLRLFKGFFH